jgi:DNA processing protein
MGSFDRDDAILMAATEVVPAEWRDLSDLLLRLDRDGSSLTTCLARSSHHDRLLDYLAQTLTTAQVEKWQDRLEELSHDRPDVWLAAVTDPRFPESLRQTYDRPPFLFVNGTLVDADWRSIAVVGSRNASVEALEAAGIVARSAAAHGATVVSGLARGVDAAAHLGALGVGGRTIAVVGTGIDQVYPPEHADLAAQITTQGAVVSQFRPGSPGTKSSFPMRNAVIAGLSLVSVLIDAEERSGTRTEAEAALRHGRTVLLWKPMLGRRAWARQWVECGAVAWASTTEDVLAALHNAKAS